MREKGQLWSLDVVLAAAVFTLAIGVILSQSELNVFYTQQDNADLRLSQFAIFASNGVTSRAEIRLHQIPLGCNASGVGCGPGEVWDNDVYENLRCGPNTKIVGTQAVHSLQWFGWGYDNELSPLENCLIDRDTGYRQNIFGVPPDYRMDLNAWVHDPVNGDHFTYLYGDTPADQSLRIIPRRMLFFPDQTSASQLRDCLDGLCSSYMTTTYVRVWRSP